VLGFGMSADAYHMTSPLEDGSGGSKSVMLHWRTLVSIRIRCSI
jgi:3-oxoacyl-(acyl-carrier-protein) synthase